MSLDTDVNMQISACEFCSFMKWTSAVCAVLQDADYILGVTVYKTYRQRQLACGVLYKCEVCRHFWHGSALSVDTRYGKEKHETIR